MPSLLDICLKASCHVVWARSHVAENPSGMRVCQGDTTQFLIDQRALTCVRTGRI